MWEAVKWPKDGHKPCFRNSKMGKNIYGLESHGKLHGGGAFLSWTLLSGENLKGWR